MKTRDSDFRVRDERLGKFQKFRASYLDLGTVPSMLQFDPYDAYVWVHFCTLLANLVQIPWFEHICWDELGMKCVVVINSSPRIYFHPIEARPYISD